MMREEDGTEEDLVGVCYRSFGRLVRRGHIVLNTRKQKTPSVLPITCLICLTAGSFFGAQPGFGAVTSTVTVLVTVSPL